MAIFLFDDENVTVSPLLLLPIVAVSVAVALVLTLRLVLLMDKVLGFETEDDELLLPFNTSFPFLS